jgi:hypothetical protein
MDGGKVGRSEYEKKDWDSEAADVRWIVDSGVPAIVWGGNYFPLPPSDKWLVWDKKNDPTTFADCELAWTNIAGAVRVFRWLWSGPYQQKREQRFHPTQKPLALMKWCLGFLPDAHTILDPFMGSGTTGVAFHRHRTRRRLLRHRLRPHPQGLRRSGHVRRASRPCQAGGAAMTRLGTFRYVPHHRIDDFHRTGWMVVG